MELKQARLFFTAANDPILLEGYFLPVPTFLKNSAINTSRIAIILISRKAKAWVKYSKMTWFPTAY
jgi:hypothetical protein